MQTILTKLIFNFNNALNSLLWFSLNVCLINGNAEMNPIINSKKSPIKNLGRFFSLLLLPSFTIFLSLKGGTRVSEIIDAARRRKEIWTFPNFQILDFKIEFLLKYYKICNNIIKYLDLPPKKILDTALG